MVWGVEASKRYLAETMGTFALVFAGTGAIVVATVYPGSISSLGIAIVFGLVVMTMIYSVGDVSGAHLNPAVTIGFWLARRLPGREVFPYIGGQVLGAIVASLLLAFLFSGTPEMGETRPSGSPIQAFVLEVVLTAFLMFVILGVATGSKEKGIMAGVAVGATVSFCALFGGPVSGASMNPARSLGPAVVGMHFEELWIYLTAPMLGAFLAVLGCRCIRESSCCD